MSQPRDRKAKYCELAALSLCGAHVCWAPRSHTGTSGCTSPSDATCLDRVQFCSKRGVKTVECGLGSRGNRPLDRLEVAIYRRLGAEDVVDLERLVDLIEPLSAVGRAAASALVERKLELAEQARHLLPCGEMAEIGPHAEGGLVDLVQRGQAAREELAIDDAFGEAVDVAEAQPHRQILQPL